jgi:hypothetical protein
LVAYWEEHAREHFRLEEEILLPAYAYHDNPHHPLVEAALPTPRLATVAAALENAEGCAGSAQGVWAGGDAPRPAL